MSFDDIPEDREETFPCDCGGEYVRVLTAPVWVCYKCGDRKEINNENN